MGIRHFLTKPYHPEDLLLHIAQEIGHTPARVAVGPFKLRAV
jgi:hypothetical protein